MGRVGFADSILFDSFRLDLRGGCLYRLDQGGVTTPVVLGSRASICSACSSSDKGSWSRKTRSWRRSGREG